MKIKIILFTLILFSADIFSQNVLMQGGLRNSKTTQLVPNNAYFVADSTWDDLVIPATSINPAGTTAPPTVSDSTGGLLFSTSADNAVTFTFQIPHSYLEGSNVVFHIHWCKTTSASGTVSWKTKYKWANIGSVFGAWSTLTEGTHIVTNDNTADKHALTAWSYTTGYSGTGKTLSSILIVYLERDTDADDYGATTILYSADLHIRKDSGGSRQQVVK